MKKFLLLCLLGIGAARLPVISHAETATGAVVQGALLFSEDGHRLGAVYKVTDDGSARLIVDGTIVTIPAATLSDVNGKLTTILTKRQVYELRSK